MSLLALEGPDAIRVLIISQWFPPEPVHKGAELARELIERGHEAIVVTGFPNYPGGRVYDGYQIRCIQKETIDGIPVVRVPIFPSHDRTGWRRFLTYASFALSASAVAPWAVGHVDVVYVYHPPGTAGLPAVLLRALRGIPFVVDVQDLWPDTLSATRMLLDRRALATVGTWMSFLYRLASAVVVLSPGFQSALEGRGVPRDKISTVYNWALGGSAAMGSLPVQPHPALVGNFNVVFAGNLGEAQGLHAVLDAARILARTNPDIRIVIAGDGVALGDLEQRSTELGLENVDFVPRQASRQAATLLRDADALLVHLRRDPLFEITIPSKTQAYLAAGRPIVMAVDGDAAALVARSLAGVTCQPDDPRSIADAIATIRKMPETERDVMGRRGKAFYDEYLSIDQGVEQLIEVFETVRSSRRGRRQVPSDRASSR